MPSVQSLTTLYSSDPSLFVQHLFVCGNGCKLCFSS